MQSQNKIFDDISKVASSAAGALNSVKGEMEDGFKAWLDRQLSDMDLVTREEFDVVKEMAEKARAENDALRVEIEKLQNKD